MNSTKHLTLTEYFPQLGFFLLGLLCLAQPAFADDTTYSGDILTRSTLTGDWGGVRNDLAQKGVTFDINVTQTEQGVIGDGKSSSWEYGGRGDLILKMDTGKMGLWPGGFLTAELEGNWGHGINLNTGALMPVNSNQIFPVPAQDGVALPALNFAQFLSEYFGVFVGKLNTLTDGDLNEFAHGNYAKGETQFMNLALNFNPTLMMAVPYSTLGAGMIILPTKDPKAAVVSLSVVSSEGKASASGFDNLNGNRLTFAGEARMRTDFFGLTGHQLVGYTYSNKNSNPLTRDLLAMFLPDRSRVRRGPGLFTTISTSICMSRQRAQARGSAFSAALAHRTETRISSTTSSASV